VIRISKEYSPNPKEPIFKPGEIVKHKRYAYRAVIVHIDLSFEGDENWYLSNQTQPSKKQPWYFTLVHGSQQVTYTAEENISSEISGKKVVHPMLNLFFSGFDSGLKRYTRNHIPWNPGNPPDAPPPTPPPNFLPPNPPKFF
jgi:heat shock protein HspQ